MKNPYDDPCQSSGQGLGTKTTFDNLNHAPINPTLAAVRAYRAGAPLPTLTGNPPSLRWTEPTQREEIHPDDWVEDLPIRPNRLPALGRLLRMSRAKRAAVLIVQITSAEMEIDGALSGRFAVPGSPAERMKFARNAQRRKTRAIKRAIELSLWNGRWQIGNLWSVIETME